MSRREEICNQSEGSKWLFIIIDKMDQNKIRCPRGPPFLPDPSLPLLSQWRNVEPDSFYLERIKPPPPSPSNPGHLAYGQIAMDRIRQERFLREVADRLATREAAGDAGLAIL